MPALIQGLLDKAQTRIHSTLQLYNSQPILTRLVILLFFAIHFSVFIFLFFYLGPEQVFDYTAQLAVYIRTSFTFPRITLIILVCIVSFPPLLGYGTLITLCGMAYGGSQKVKVPSENGEMVLVPEGSLFQAWALAASACMIGSLFSFLVLRSFLLNSSIGRKLTRIDSLRASRQWRAMEQAIGQRGLSMVILVRFSPFPFNVSNLFFASLQSVPPSSFIIATATTTPKLLLHVFIGNRLFQLFDRGARAGLDTNAKILNGVYVVVGGLMGAAASWYVYRETNHILSMFEQEEESQEGMERGRHQTGQPMSMWDGVSDERRSFLDDPNAINGLQQYARRSNSVVWDRERRSGSDSKKSDDNHM